MPVAIISSRSPCSMPRHCLASRAAQPHRNALLREAVRSAHLPRRRRSIMPGRRPGAERVIARARSDRQPRRGKARVQDRRPFARGYGVAQVSASTRHTPSPGEAARLASHAVRMLSASCLAATAPRTRWPPDLCARTPSDLYPIGSGTDFRARSCIRASQAPRRLLANRPPRIDVGDVKNGRFS